MSDTQATGGQPAGWYPEPGTNRLRWWDGNQWGAYQEQAMPPAAQPAVAGAADPKQNAALAHYLGAGILFISCGLGWVGPLIMYVSNKDKDQFVEYHAAEALNFQITIAIAMFVSGLLAIVVIGFLLLPIVWLVGIIFGVMGGMAASRGEWYRYPINIRMVKSSVNPG